MTTTAASSSRTVRQHNNLETQKPAGVQVKDCRFIKFDSPFGSNVPRTILTLCMEHTFASSENTFIRTFNYTRGDKITGLPYRGNTPICAESKVISNTRNIAGCCIEASVILETPGSNDRDTITANTNQIIAAIEIHLLPVRKAFKQSSWRFDGIKQTLGDAIIEFPRYFWTKLF
jgi:hypothetical protein